MSELLPAAIVFAVAIAILATYLMVRGHLTTVADALDKTGMVEEATGFWSRLNARLLGWKTIILAWLAAIAQVLASPDVTAALTGAHWEAVLDQRTANIVSLVCTLLIPLTHAAGLSKAAVTPPVDQG